MDVEERMRLIALRPTEEIVTEEELRQLLETKEHPKAYDGFEPSGYAHIGSGLQRAIKARDLADAGVDFVILLADWHAYLNNKMGGDMEKIHEAGKYFKKVWELLGAEDIKIVWASDLIERTEYWERLLRISTAVTVDRIKRAGTIMGRKNAEMQKASFLIYPLMQATDIFELGVDICQLGMDQRKVNILAREVAEKFGWQKPVLVHHHLLLGLQAGKRMGKEVSAEDLKMSKSKPDTAIYVHDSPEEIKRKMKNAYCPAGVVENNPVIDIVRNLILRGRDDKEVLVVERPEKFGGTVEYYRYEDLGRDFVEGKLHPLDLKNAVAEWLIDVLAPVRNYFEKHGLPEFNITR
ncbi:MAG: tyrosine--tRNA ligase [Candidatus Diapherotrites archaeon]|nr:tyrosine--tRNA ligase [Candidatus Diapherotrites archaeon]